MAEYFIAWWNIENLFDIENSPFRSERVKKVLGDELKGWNNSILNKKIKQLTKVISNMNNNNGPDILGICEVEGGPVINKLVNKIKEKINRDYKIVHEKVDDKRGIEVGFIYDNSKFKVNKDSKTGEDLVFSHHVLRQEATRNILQVNFKIKSTNTDLILVGNHWPSRTMGEIETEPYRIAAADALSYFHRRIIEELGPDTCILAMGDFNDMPFNRSLMDYAFSTPYKEQVEKSEDTLFFYNLMWTLISNGYATCYFGKEVPDPCIKKFTTYPNMLDQFMISKVIALEKKLKIKQNSVRVIKKVGDVELFETRYGYEIPKKFGRPTNCGNKGYINEDGFSDHFPISLVIEEK